MLPDGTLATDEPSLVPGELLTARSAQVLVVSALVFHVVSPVTFSYSGCRFHSLSPYATGLSRSDLLTSFVP